MINEYDKHVFETSPLTTFFYVLCKKPQGWYQSPEAEEKANSEESLEIERRIPDTVVWENNIPKGWFTYDNNEKQIVRRKMETQVVYSVMTQGSKDESDVVAILCGKNNAKDESLFFEYLTRQSLKVLLFESKRAKGTVVLQKFMKPFNGLHVDTLQATWSPNVMRVNRRQNIYSYKDTTLPALTRCATFEGPPHLSRQVCVSPQLESKVHAMCDNFVRHFHVTDPKYAISRMVMYFVLSGGSRSSTETSRLYFMYTPCVRVSYINRQEPVRTALELRSLFDTSGIALRRLLSTEGALEEGKTSPHLEKKKVPIQQPSSADIWKTTNERIFPEFKGARMVGGTPVPSGVSGEVDASLTPPPARRNLAALLSEYKTSRQEHRHMKSKCIRGLRAMRHQIEVAMEDEDVCKEVRTQLLHLKEPEGTLTDAEKMELLHLTLQKQNAIGRDSVYNLAKAARAAQAQDELASLRATPSLYDFVTQSLGEILAEFEYEVTSHFMQYPIQDGRNTGPSLVYTFQKAVPIDTVKGMAAHLGAPMKDEHTVEVQWRKHIGHEVRQAINDALQSLAGSSSGLRPTNR